MDTGGLDQWVQAVNDDSHNKPDCPLSHLLHVLGVWSIKDV